MTTFNFSRVIAATAEEVFSAICNQERLERWWGPNDFSNTSTIFEFHEGGRWSLTMHGPNGKSFPNEVVFEKIEAPNRVLIQHVSMPKYSLDIELAPTVSGTLVSWAQTFESAKAAENARHIVLPAGEQMLDRLTLELTREP